MPWHILQGVLLLLKWFSICRPNRLGLSKYGVGWVCGHNRLVFGRDVRRSEHWFRASPNIPKVHTIHGVHSVYSVFRLSPSWSGYMHPSGPSWWSSWVPLIDQALLWPLIMGLKRSHSWEIIKMRSKANGFLQSRAVMQVQIKECD